MSAMPGVVVRSVGEPTCNEPCILPPGHPLAGTGDGECLGRCILVKHEPQEWHWDGKHCWSYGATIDDHPERGETQP